MSNWPGLATSRIIKMDGWEMSTGHACPHVQAVALDEATDVQQLVVAVTFLGPDDKKVMARFKTAWDTDREAIKAAVRQQVGVQVTSDGRVLIGVCTDPNCYPAVDLLARTA